MVNIDDVKKISKLAKLKLCDADLQRYAADLSSTVELCKKIDVIDTSALSQDIHPEDKMPERHDICYECDPNVMNNAPDELYGMFAVPKVIE